MDTLRAKCAVYMCRKWVRFGETVTISCTSFGRFWWKTRRRRYHIIYTIRSDRSDFILHFSCIFSQPTRIPNDCKRSGLQLPSHYTYTLLLYTHTLYSRPFGCTKESILWASIMLGPTYAYLFFSPEIYHQITLVILIGHVAV